MVWYCGALHLLYGSCWLPGCNVSFSAAAPRNLCSMEIVNDWKVQRTATLIQQARSIPTIFNCNIWPETWTDGTPPEYQIHNRPWWLVLMESLRDIHGILLAYPLDYWCNPSGKHWGIVDVFTWLLMQPPRLPRGGMLHYRGAVPSMLAPDIARIFMYRGAVPLLYLSNIQKLITRD